MNAGTINWPLEAAAFRDMIATASRGHEIAAEAIRTGIAAAESPLEQKVLFAKLCGEEIAGLEDLGALGRAISVRRHRGVLRNYLEYDAKHIRRFYEDVRTADSAAGLMDLPAFGSLSEQFSSHEIDELSASLISMDRAFQIAARNYLALDGALVTTYSKIKNGFNLIQRIDLLVPETSIHEDWREQVHVVTGVTRGGKLNFSSIERSEDMLETLVGVITGCAATWRELASLIVLLLDRGVPLSE